MLKHGKILLSLVLVAASIPSRSTAQRPPDPATASAAQREAMARLAFMDGVWRGRASTMLPSGERIELVQTERVGTFLDGALRVIEGRGYDMDGRDAFQALGIVSFDPEANEYRLRSYARGQVGDFTLTIGTDGFQWEIPAGPMTIRYTATIDGDSWHEVGDRLVPGEDPVRFFEMTLSRVGDTDWPAAGAIGPG